MSIRPARLGAALCGLAVAAVLSGCAGTEAPAAAALSASEGPSASSTSAPAGQRIEVQVSGGRVTGDSGRVPVSPGAPVTVVVTSDVADTAHLHGYDLDAELSPGQPAELTFDATIPGVFELELHEASTVLLTLQVG
ncbi:MAG TPA: hypothetical protein VK402_12350 [Blastococcus sp.]|nr:hypothetical protein [Blastococcus sp.]